MGGEGRWVDKHLAGVGSHFSPTMWAVLATSAFNSASHPVGLPLFMFIRLFGDGRVSHCSPGWP